MIGKSLFLLVFVIWLYITAKFYEHYTLGPIISFLILCLATWKVFGISKAFLLIAFGVLIYVMDSDFVGKKFLIPFCITCLFGWGVFEWVVKPLGRQWLSAYGAIGLIIIISRYSQEGIHKRFENKNKVNSALRAVREFLIPFCITCLFGWGVFEWVVKPYGAIGLIIIIIAIIFTLMLMVGIHKGFENKNKVDSALRPVRDIQHQREKIEKILEESERERQRHE